MKNIVGNRIKLCREMNKETQDQLGELCGVHKSTVSRWENGETDKISLATMSLIARHYNVSESWIAGKDVSMVVKPTQNNNVCMLPVYDSAAAGFNVLAQDTIVGYEPANIATEIDQHIYVHVVGDSMAPTIDDGSKILVKKQESVDSGQIAVVLIDGEEAVVKRVVYGTDWIELQSVNPYYPPRRFEGADVQRIRVIGLVKEVIKTLA